MLHSLLFLHTERIIRRQNDQRKRKEEEEEDEEEDDVGIDIDRDE